MKNILWKEFRENWAVVLVGIIFAGFVTYILFSNRELAGMVSDPKYLLLTVPLFISMLIANIFTTEFAHKTLPFLLILPISRNKLWVHKALIGLVFSIILVCGTIGSIIVVSHFTAKPVPLNVFYNFTGTELKDFLSIGLLFYAIALFVSVLFTKNTITAGFGGLMLTMFLGLYWLLFIELFYLSDKWYGDILIPIILTICSSWYAFTTLDVEIAKNRVIRGLTFFFTTFIIVTIILILIQSNWDPVPLSKIKTIYPVLQILGKNMVLAQIVKQGETRYSESRFWLISLKDGRYQKYPGKGYDYYGDGMTSGLSPDSRFILLGNKRQLFRLVESKLFFSRFCLLDTATLTLCNIPMKRSGIFEYDRPISWTPDSRKILYKREYVLNEAYKYWLTDINTGEVKMLHVPKNIYIYFPKWASDGNSFFTYDFLSKDTIQDKYMYGIYQISLEGKILWQHISYYFPSHELVSPDRKWLLFTQSTVDRSEPHKLYLENLYTYETTLVFTANHFGRCFWSPDGKWLTVSVYNSRSKPVPVLNPGVKHKGVEEQHKDEVIIWLINLESKEKKKIANLAEYNIDVRGWSKDNKRIFYSYSDEKTYCYKAIDIATGQVSNRLPLEYEYSEYSSYPVEIGNFMVQAKPLLLSDGKYLVSTGRELYLITADGKQTKRIFPQKTIQTD